MRFPLHIALRYLFSKKKHNAINIISGICAVGIALATTALVGVLSVYNGFQDLISQLFSSLDPDLKISLVEGKVFDSDMESIQKVKTLDFVKVASEVLEDNALVRNENKQAAITLKGVDSCYNNLADTDAILHAGQFVLKDSQSDYAVIGAALSAQIEVGVNFVSPITLYTPKHDTKINVANPENAFQERLIYVSGIYSIRQQETDSKFVFIPLDLARELFDYEGKACTSIELKIDGKKDIEDAKREIEEILGEGFSVKDKEQQHDDFYSMLKIEKWITFLILTFILLIAVFNVIGSLTMLILEKKNDIETLHSLGASYKEIRKIFVAEGWMITVFGTFAGVILGLAFCLCQQWFGIIKLDGDGSGSFIVNAYPVDVQFSDIITIIATVLLAGLLIAWYPTRNIGKQKTGEV
jgi:ABC-type lipoprotein release transport system permease subunit